MEKFNLILKQYKNNDTYTHFRNPLIKGYEVSDEVKEKRVKSRKSSEKYTSDESKRKSLQRTRKKIFDKAKMCDWEWSITLTLDPDKIDRYDAEVVRTKISDWLSNIKKTHAPNLKYILVPELHKDKALHFHCLFSNVGSMNFVETDFTDRGGRKVYNLQNYRFGWTYATQVGSSERITNYIVKYITKDLMEWAKNKKRFWSSRNIEAPKVYIALVDNEQYKTFIATKDEMGLIKYSTSFLVDSDGFENEVSIHVIDRENNENDK